MPNVERNSMARIRTLKPEFWADEKLSPLDPTTRLVFLGLINHADDAGRLLDNVKHLDGLIFPNTRDSCAAALDCLATLSRVCRYTSASGQRLLQLTNWDKHQKVDRPSKYVLPAPTLADLSRDPHEIVATPSRESRVTTLDLGPRTEDLGSRTVDLGAWSLGDEATKRGGWGDLEQLGGWSGIIAACDADQSSAHGAVDAIGGFLASRRESTRPAWVREMAKLVTGTPFTGADLGGACADAMAVERPLDGPHALRAFMAKRRDERLKGVSRDPGVRPASQEDRRVAEARERAELDRQAVIDRVKTAKRDAAVAEWSAREPAMLAVLESEAASRFGKMTGNMGDMVRREWIIAKLIEDGAIQVPT